MVRQYQELKSQHPGALLFFRLGDFYELFFEDAVVGARELQITLTARHKERGDAIPMCGVPHHSAANYIAKLVRKGYRVAICEQTEDASKTKKLVRREVVRIVTPGTPNRSSVARGPRVNISQRRVRPRRDGGGVAFLDVSTGEFRATQAGGPEAWNRIAADIESYSPRELLFPASLAPLVRAGFRVTAHTEPLPLPALADNSTAQTNTTPDVFGGATLTALDDWLWQSEDAESLLIKHFGVQSLDGFGLTGKTAAIVTAGSCLRYAIETQRGFGRPYQRSHLFRTTGSPGPRSA